MKRIIEILFAVCLCLALPGCAEEELAPAAATDDGAAHNLTFTLQTPYMVPMTREVGQTKMDLDGVTRYSILLYEKQEGTDGTSGRDWVLDQVVTGDLTQGGGNGSTSTETTQSFSTTASVPEGTYLAFAVANLPAAIDVANKTYEGADISTADKLRALNFTWTDDNKTVMFGTFYMPTDATFEGGHFTSSTTNLENSIDRDIRKKGMANVNPTDYPKDYNAIAFEIDKEHLQAHIVTKLYPMAALVTVYFDTYRLETGNRIKINSISLKNIPATCSLWEANTPEAENDLMEDDIFYPNYTRDANGNGHADEYIEHYSDRNNQYSRNTYDYGAIFFLYENRQGMTETTTLAEKTVKDKKPYATYVEVDATHYDANNVKTNLIYHYAIGEDAPANTGEGTFGETVLYNNYNVTRNRHYKVYLTLTGSGKDHATEGLWMVEVADLSASPSFTYDYTGQVSNGTVTLVKSSDGTTVTADEWSVVGDLSDWATLSSTSGTGAITFTYQPKEGLAAKTYTGQVTVKFKINSKEYSLPVTLTYTKYGFSEVVFSFDEAYNTAVWTKDLSLNGYADDNTAWLRLKTTPKAEFHNLTVTDPTAYTVNETSSPQYNTTTGTYTADENGYLFLPLTLNEGAAVNGKYTATVKATDLVGSNIALLRSVWDFKQVVASCQFNGSEISNAVLNTELAEGATNTFAVACSEEDQNKQSFGRDGADGTAPSVHITDDLTYAEGLDAEDTYLMKNSNAHFTITVKEGQQLAMACLSRYGSATVKVYDNEDFANSTPVFSQQITNTAGTTTVTTGKLTTAGTYYVTVDSEVFFYYLAVLEEKAKPRLKVALTDAEGKTLSKTTDTEYLYGVGDDIWLRLTTDEHTSGRVAFKLELQNSESNNQPLNDVASYLEDQDDANLTLEYVNTTDEVYIEGAEPNTTYLFHWKTLKAMPKVRFKLSSGTTLFDNLNNNQTNQESITISYICVNEVYEFTRLQYSADGKAWTDYTDGLKTLQWVAGKNIYLRAYYPAGVSDNIVLTGGKENSDWGDKPEYYTTDDGGKYVDFNIPAQGPGTTYTIYFRAKPQEGDSYEMFHSPIVVRIKVVNDPGTYEWYCTDKTPHVYLNGKVYEDGGVITMEDSDGLGYDTYSEMSKEVDIYSEGEDSEGKITISSGVKVQSSTIVTVGELDCRMKMHVLMLTRYDKKTSLKVTNTDTGEAVTLGETSVKETFVEIETELEAETEYTLTRGENESRIFYIRLTPVSGE